MHGVRRTRQSAADIEARRLKEQSKIEDYLLLSQDVLLRKKSQDWSEDALKLTTRLLRVNPEFYTIWNYRRNILLNGIFPKSNAEKVNELLSNDLVMTMAALKAHPKVYWIWNHRRWCLEAVPNGPGTENDHDFNGWKKSCWESELYVVEKMLDADPRNFHAWSYRRYVHGSMPIPRLGKSELDYTTRKIEANFSNFSAWHQRSKVLTLLWRNDQLDESQSKEDEFELIRNAMYTDPNDQSVWLYHRWLVGSGKDQELLQREISVIRELLDEQPDSKWCMESIVHYNQLLMRQHGSTVDITAASQECINLLRQLTELDTLRRKRYRDLKETIQAFSS